MWDGTSPSWPRNVYVYVYVLDSDYRDHRTELSRALIRLFKAERTGPRDAGYVLYSDGLVKAVYSKRLIATIRGACAYEKSV
jgi:hypothetical protein